jgi:dihydrofolate reductase
MRNVVVSEFVSLDGVVEDPSWTFPFESEDKDQYKFDELAAADALLLGRVTYEGFAAAWPQMEEPLEWNNSTLIEGDLAVEVTRLKEQDGKDILVFGSGDLVNALMRHDLIDEYRLMVFPVVVGSGKRLFGEGDTKTLKLVETKTFDSGAVVLTYEPAGDGD